MKFRIGETVLNKGEYKTIKDFCGCCTERLENDEFEVRPHSRIFFASGRNVAAAEVKKMSVGKQLEFNF